MELSSMGATAAGLIFLGFCLVLSSFIFISIRLYTVHPDLVRKISKYILIAIFWLVFSVAGLVIGYRIDSRHTETYSRGMKSVTEIWGGSINQTPPSLTFDSTVKEEYENKKTGELMDKTVLVEKGLGFASQDIILKIKKNIRQKGLLLYPGYDLQFEGKYVIKNYLPKKNKIHFRMALPSYAGNITNVSILLNGKDYKEDTNLADGIDWTGELEADEEKEIVITYRAQGSSSFQYSLGAEKIEMKQFHALIESDFENYDIPDYAMAPSKAESDANFSKLEWVGENIITGQNLSIEFEIKGNYGKLASKLFFYSPISLALFLALLLLLAIPNRVQLHPMNYLFIIISYFIFYLLGSYLVTFLDIVPGLLLSLLVSTLILLQYTIALKKGKEIVRYNLLSTLIFQWLFSIAFFFPEYTGLFITLATIGSFIYLSRVTAEIDWEDKF